MKLKELQKTVRALADETRLRILHLISTGELCVCDVMSILKEPQSKISRHFAYLKKSGMVIGRKEGLWMYYRLSPEGEKVFKPFLRSLCAKERQVDEFCCDLEVLKKKKAGGCC